MPHKALQFQLCVCVYICVCLAPGVPSPSFVISLSAVCDMEAPAISFTQLFTGFRLVPQCMIPLCYPSRVHLSSTSPSPLPLLQSSRSLRLSRCLPNTPTASSSSRLLLPSLPHMHFFVCAHLSRK